MLTLVELHDLFDRLGTPPAGRQLVETARRLAPVRQVQSNSSNVITRYASRKMGRLVDCESRTVEYPAVIQYEHDPEVLEYYVHQIFNELLLAETSAPFRRRGLVTSSNGMSTA